MTPQRRAVSAALTVLVLLVSAIGCAANPAVPASASFTENGVTVSAALAGTGHERRLSVELRPMRTGFHIYSIDLPDGGIDGLGIPTRLSVRGSLTALGAPTADRPVRELQLTGLTEQLPVYPDGPVTFVLPVGVTGTESADVVVSYGACSEAQCLVPVHDHVLTLTVGR